MEILIIHKEPILDRIPNLKAFIVHANNQGNKVTIISTKNEVYPEPSFLTNNINYITVKERSRNCQLPTFIRFYLKCFMVLLSKTFKPYSLILAGKFALVLGFFLRLKKFSAFIIEYPELNLESFKKLTFFDKLECRGITRSDLLITHDALHAKLIMKNLGVKKKYVTIPNGTIGKAKTSDSDFLQKRLKLDKKSKLVLHSGGFGPWFMSKELAERSISLQSDFELVFHLSHDINNDDYYKEYLLNKASHDKTLFSMRPVPTHQLDELISSAYIGVAWYSAQILGFRALNLGLSAGKIGNYLKCGIPVIVPNYTSLDYVTTYKCGVQISSLNELNLAIEEIERNYESFVENAINCYDTIWNTTKYTSQLIEKLK